MPQVESKPLSGEPGVFLPKQERSSRTQAAILQAARAMVSEGGVESLTISGVAARVGLTTGAFYARFRNKDGLLQALFEEKLAGNRSAIDSFRFEIAASTAPLIEIITNFVPGAPEPTGRLARIRLSHTQFSSLLMQFSKKCCLQPKKFRGRRTALLARTYGFRSTPCAFAIDNGFIDTLRDQRVCECVWMVIIGS
jgi:AcrR family transcriptional regulator